MKKTLLLIAVSTLATHLACKTAGPTRGTSARQSSTVGNGLDTDWDGTATEDGEAVMYVAYFYITAAPDDRVRIKICNNDTAAVVTAKLQAAWSAQATNSGVLRTCRQPGKGSLRVIPFTGSVDQLVIETTYVLNGVQQVRRHRVGVRMKFFPGLEVEIPGFGCGHPHAGECDAVDDAPFCSNQVCCSAVCAVNASCCTDAWTQDCVDLANGLRNDCEPLSCGDSRSGDCRTAHATPYCTDRACCDTVCALVEKCCSVEWTADCATIAESLCTP